MLFMNNGIYPCTYSIAMIGPSGFLIFALILFVLIARPGIIPYIFRIAGILFRIRNSIQKAGSLKGDQSSVRVQNPDHIQPTLRVQSEESLSQPVRTEFGPPIWLVAALAAGAFAVLLWFLLHSR
jgi:hypothetical protein